MVLLALRSLPENRLMGWVDLAAYLNDAKLRSPRGRAWSDRTIAGFVRGHLAKTGENVLPWFKGATSVGGLESDSAKRRWAKSGDGRLVERLCVGARSHGEAARILNALGLKTVRGRTWTTELVRELAKRQKRNILPAVSAHAQPPRDVIAKPYRTWLRKLVSELAGEARGFGQVADILNRRGVATERGKRWTMDNVQRFEQAYRREVGGVLFPRIRRKPRRKERVRGMSHGGGHSSGRIV